MRRIKLRLWLAVLAVFASSRAASADIVQVKLDTTNLNSTTYPGPYGTVTVNRTDSTHATITFSASVVNGKIYLFGDGATAALNVNSTNFSVSNLSSSNSGTGFTTPTLTAENP